MAGSGEAPRPFGLSKSRITAYEQCPRKLWLSVHRPDLITSDPVAEVQFHTGHQIGAIACALEPDGVMIDAVPDLTAALNQTRALIDQGHPGPLFEATFVHDGVLVRVDVLARGPEGGWVLAEVKSTTGVKAYHHGDLATQVWVLGGCGLQVSSAVIRHIDNRFVLTRVGDYRGLFIDRPLLDVLEERIAERPALAQAARDVLAGPEPAIEPGSHCSDPFDCGFARHCGQHLPPPPKWPIALLPRTGARIAAEWALRGVSELTLVPEGSLANRMHDRIHRATLAGAAYHDPLGVRAATSSWTQPLAFLDFETIAPAVPRWVGTRPFQAIPFQFSCHIQEADGSLSHAGFLDVSGEDPRRSCAEALIQALGGSNRHVVAYNASFERGVILGLARDVPELEEDLRAISERLVDLLPVAREHYYHPDQRGSWSIKAVLPTLAPKLDYHSLEVQDGQAAQRAWLEATASTTSPDRKLAIIAALEAYCERDTLAMVVMLEQLRGPDIQATA
jgi:hypothetical protein